MKKNKINVALFGLGRIGQMHAQNLFDHNEFNLKYIFDIDKRLGKKFSKKYNCTSIIKPEIALKDKNVRIIFIATSTGSHLKFIQAAVKEKKIVFCEKPLDLDLKKINICKKNISSYKPKIQMGFNRRYDPGHHSLKKNLNNNKIGKLEKIIITSRDPSPPSLNYIKKSGGIFKDMMIHDFDLARYYAGKDKFEYIFATGNKFSDKKYKKINDLELATVVLKSKRGIQCIITNSRHCSFGYDQRVELFGNKGMMISDNQRNLETTFYLKNHTNNKVSFKDFFIERYAEAFKIQLGGLVKFYRKKIKPRSDFEDGRISLIMAETAKKSFISKKFEKIKI